jgi:hypothetical protein
MSHDGVRWDMPSSEEDFRRFIGEGCSGLVAPIGDSIDTESSSFCRDDRAYGDPCRKSAVIAFGHCWIIAAGLVSPLDSNVESCRLVSSVERLGL